MVPPLLVLKIPEFSGTNPLNPYSSSDPGNRGPIGDLHITGLEDLPAPQTTPLDPGLLANR